MTIHFCALHTDIDHLLKENKRMQQEMEMLKKDYNTEMERLEKENSQLKARARKEKEEKESFEQAVEKRDRIILGLKNELKEIKGETKIFSKV